MGAKEYVESGAHLPDILKDFHDQKDFFKAIYQKWGEGSEVLNSVKWTDAHVFTIDIFLHWAGLHGYKLQKSRAKNVEFYDIVDTIQHCNKIKSDQFSQMLSQRLNPSPTTLNPQNTGGNAGEGVGER